METPLENGLAPFQQNGHDHLVHDHEVVSDDLQQTNLLTEELFTDEESPTVPTVKKDTPETEPDQLDDTPTKKKSPKRSASISTTLNHCEMFNAAALTMGAGYATRHAMYELTNLEAMHTAGVGHVAAVTKSETTYKYAVTLRKDVFGPVETLLTRILAEVLLSGASATTVDQVRSLIRKLRGARAVAKDPSVPAEDYHSVSQRNYDDIVDNFARLVSLVAEDSDYDPMADDLKVLALETTHDGMRTANTKVIYAKADLDGARDARNMFFNTKVTGLVDVFITAKKVVLANFGTKSEYYKRVKGLRFLRIVS